MAYIQIDRKLFCHFLWTENRVWSKFEAWIDLIQLVSFADNNERIINGILVKWDRGEFPVSYSFLSQRWNWTAQRTRGYMQLLKSNNQINTRTTSVATILTLCNYDQYNPKQQADKRKTTSGTTSGQQADNKRTAGIKEDKEDKEDKEGKEFNFKTSLIGLGVSEKVASDWLTVRKTKKASNTETAFNKIKKQIELTRASANDCITMAVENSWQGFESEWYFNKKPESKNQERKVTGLRSSALPKELQGWKQ